MMRALFLCFFFLVPVLTFSAEVKPATVDYFEMTGVYYQHPTRNNVVEALRWFDRERVFLDDAVVPGLEGFYAGIFITGVSDEMRGVIAGMSVEGKQVMAAAEHDLAFVQRPGVSRVRDLEFLWGVFGATGDLKYVRPIVSASIGIETRKDKILFLIGYEALWSLCEKAQVHPTVMAYLKEVVSRASGQQKVYLARVVDKAKAKQPFFTPREQDDIQDMVKDTEWGDKVEK